MKNLTPVNIEKYLSQIEDIPILVVYGEERFFHDQVMIIVENRIFKTKSEKSLNCYVFYGTENKESDILSACLSYPMLADHKLVIVKEFDKLKMYDKDSFLKYIANPQPSTILVLSADKWGDSDFHHKIMEKSISVKCTPLYENQLFNWVTQKFLDYNIAINKDAIRFLIENIGQNLLNLNSEIEKIISYTGSGNSIEFDDIAQLTGFSKEVNIFNFQKILAEKKLAASLKIGFRLLEQGESLAAVLPMLFHFFRRMWVVKQLQVKKYSKNKILQLVKGNPYLYSDIFLTASNFSKERLEYIIESIETAEIQLKTSQRDSSSILTMLCYNICKS
jgi:DNA polymerase-3 subunit delta